MRLAGAPHGPVDVELLGGDARQARAERARTERATRSSAASDSAVAFRSSASGSAAAARSSAADGAAPTGRGDRAPCAASRRAAPGGSSGDPTSQGAPRAEQLRRAHRRGAR